MVEPYVGFMAAPDHLSTKQVNPSTRLRQSKQEAAAAARRSSGRLDPVRRRHLHAASVLSTLSSPSPDSASIPVRRRISRRFASPLSISLDIDLQGSPASPSRFCFVLLLCVLKLLPSASSLLLCVMYLCGLV